MSFLGAKIPAVTHSVRYVNKTLWQTRNL